MSKKNIFLRYVLLISMGAGVLLWAPGELQAATKIFLHDAVSPQGKVATGGVGYGCYNGTNDSIYRVANTTQGSSTVTDTFTPATSTTPCRLQTANGPAEFLTWITPPISAVVTISGNINYSVGCRESHNNLNLGMSFVVQRWSHATGGIVSTVDSGVTTECATSLALRTIAASAPTTTTTFQIGDKIVIYLDAVGAGSFGGNNSRTAAVGFDGAAAGTGDTFVNFVDTISFSADAARGQSYAK